MSDNFLYYHQASNESVRKLVRALFGADKSSTHEEILQSKKGILNQLNNEEIEAIRFTEKIDGIKSCSESDIPQNNELIFKKKDLRNYQKQAKITLAVKNKNGTGYSYIRLEDLKNNNIVDNLDKSDLKKVVDALKELSIVKSQDKPKGNLFHKKFYHRICLSGPVPVFHRYNWIKNQYNEYSLLDKMREQYCIAYPSWPNFQKGTNENEQWSELGVKPPFSEDDCIKAYKDRIKEILELQVESIGKDGKNQLTINFPGDFFSGIKKEFKEKLLGTFAEAVDDITKKYEKITFFIINEGKIAKNSENVHINNKGYDAIEYNQNEYIKKEINSEAIDVALNLLPHDTRPIGNGCFSSGGDFANDERAARVMPTILSIMNSTRNKSLSEQIQNYQTKVQEITQSTKPEQTIKNQTPTTKTQTLQDAAETESNSNTYMENIEKLKQQRDKLKTAKDCVDNKQYAGYFVNKLTSNTMTDVINQQLSHFATEKGVSLIDDEKFCSSTTEKIPEIEYNIGGEQQKTKSYIGFGGIIDVQSEQMFFKLNNENSFLKDKFSKVDSDICKIINDGLTFAYPKNIDEKDKLGFVNYFTAMAKSDPYVAMQYMLDKGCILKDNQGKEIDGAARTKLMQHLADFTEQKKLMDELEKQRKEITKNKDNGSKISGHNAEKLIIASVLEICLVDEKIFENITGKKNINANIFVDFFSKQLDKSNNEEISVDIPYIIKETDLEIVKKFIKKYDNQFKLEEQRRHNSHTTEQEH